MALTKVNSAALDACQAIAATTMLEGAEADVSASYDSAIKIWAALTNNTANASGVTFTVQTSNAASGDEGWVDFLQFIGLSGTATVPLVNHSDYAPGTTTLALDATTNFTQGSWAFIQDNAASPVFANSEFVRIASVSSPNITLVDGIARTVEDNSPVSNTANSWRIQLPFSAKRARVLVLTTAATVAYKSSLVTVTAVS